PDQRERCDAEHREERARTDLDQLHLISLALNAGQTISHFELGVLTLMSRLWWPLRPPNPPARHAKKPTIISISTIAKMATTPVEPPLSDWAMVFPPVEHASTRCATRRSGQGLVRFRTHREHHLAFTGGASREPEG